jgi:hydroxyethylthiazole kinase
MVSSRRKEAGMMNATMAARQLTAIRETTPLVHSITNFVVMNETANALLALGASPVMAHAAEEVEEIASAAGAVVLNIGTLWPGLVESMVLAGKAANRAGVPVVLDPVGAGFTRLRNQAVERILDEVSVAMIRGNAAEVAFLAGASAQIRGVDSLGISEEAAEVARTLARARKCTVAVTGIVDVVADDERVFRIANGHELMARITGSGCMSTTMCAAFAAVCEDPVQAAAGALAVFGLAGERAAAGSPGPGTFHARLYDELHALTAEVVVAGARIERA